MEEWLRCIQQVIQFPFYTKVTEWQDDTSIVQEGDLLKVHAIGDIDDKYGIIANTRFGRKKLYFPLCELEAIDLSDIEKNVLQDYAVWFANK